MRLGQIPRTGGQEVGRGRYGHPMAEHRRQGAGVASRKLQEAETRLARRWRWRRVGRLDLKAADQAGLDVIDNTAVAWTMGEVHVEVHSSSEERRCLISQ